MKQLLTTTLLFIFTALASAHACAVPRLVFSGLFEADVIIRGTFINYEVLKMHSKARVTFEVSEILKGSAGHGELSAIWEHSNVPDRWNGPKNAIVALRRSGSAEADYAIVQPRSGLAEISGAKDKRTIVRVIGSRADARRPVDHPTPFEPTECFNLTRKGSRAAGAIGTVGKLQKKSISVLKQNGNALLI